MLVDFSKHFSGILGYLFTLLPISVRSSNTLRIRCTHFHLKEEEKWPHSNNSLVYDIRVDLRVSISRFKNEYAFRATFGKRRLHVRTARRTSVEWTLLLGLFHSTDTLWSSISETKCASSGQVQVHAARPHTRQLRYHALVTSRFISVAWRWLCFHAIIFLGPNHHWCHAIPHVSFIHYLFALNVDINGWRCKSNSLIHASIVDYALVSFRSFILCCWVMIAWIYQLLITHAHASTFSRCYIQNKHILD